MPEVLALSSEDPGAVGPYTLEGRLGAGGQGVVYVGRDGGGGRVAVKLLHAHLMADEQARRRFLREVETARRVAPFCTAQVLDSGFLGGRPYIVSEFVDGPSLQSAVRDNGPRGAAALQRLAVNTATALAGVHQAGVVHRDFKPANVLLGPDGPVVIDFGIARALDLSQSAVSSQPIGSPAYMAPEQIAGDAVGPAADLFAWGATMVYAATGQRAFPGDSIPRVLHTILQGEPELGRLDGVLRELVGACLAKDPSLRPTAAQLVERLRAVPASPPITSGTPHGPAAPGPFTSPAAPAGGAGRRPLIVGAVSVVMLVAAATGYLAWAPGERTAGAAAPTVSSPASAPVSSPAVTTPEAPTPTPEGSAQSSSAKATSKAAATRIADPTRTPAATHKPRTSPADPAPDAPTATREPARKPTSRPAKSTPPPDDDPPPPSQGTITFTDVQEYCKAQGQNMGGGTWDNLWCFGGARITATTVCQWKFQGRDAVAEQPSNNMANEVTCRLT
ncbi:protein kinase [Nonomuraea sp. NPDC005692]|uniref:serine/threonine-protein kinase n=1 Tax=Nonomuraea sp. NPDC005692 TaxID=3157168 RepID=UPI0033EA2977